jgi:pimeloyl-ACP methyl ester carboxylesterase
LPPRASRKTVKAGGVAFEVRRLGRGRPLLVLHGEDGLEADLPFVATLAKSREVILPSHPGFGRSSRPDWVQTVDDISYLYLDLLEKLGLKGLDVIGCGLGGWIAAEIAAKTCERLRRLVLVDAFGIKVGGPYERDIADFFYLPPPKVAALKFHDPAKGARDFKSMPDEALEIVARNRESLARFCWTPFMHNPQLVHRLHRIALPTLVIWGDSDGIVTPAYGKALAKKIPGARFALVKKTGHLPHLEQPEAFLKLVGPFLAAKGRR